MRSKNVCPSDERIHLTGDGSQKIKICVMLPRLKIGGAEMQVLSLLANLDRKRFEPHLCVLNRGDAKMEEAARRNVESLTCLDFRWRKLLVVFPRLVCYLKRERFDILHAHLALADSLGRIAGRFACVPVLMTTEHGKHLWKGRLYLMMERILARSTDMRICVSDDIARIRVTRERTPEEKLTVIPNSVDPAPFRGAVKGRAAVMAEFEWEVEDPLVVTVGRLVVAKAYPSLVEAVSFLKEEFPSVRCLIAGDGPCREEIEEAVEKYGVSGNVTLPGARRDIPDLLSACDVFVLSSIREGLPVSLLEAMASGCAIAATTAGGIPEAVRDGESALLVPPDEPRALAGAIGRLLGNRELATRFGENASRVIDKMYSAAAVTREIEDIYTRLAAAARGEDDRSA